MKSRTGTTRRARRRRGPARRRLRDGRLALRAAAARRHPTGLVRVSLPDQDPEETLEELAARSRPGCSRRRPGSTRPAASSTSTSRAGCPSSTCRSTGSSAKGFRSKALRAIDRIPYGQTRSYTEIARSAGNERAVRAAGTACGSNPIPIVVPCHRVLRSGGGLGGYGGGLPMKEALLELEGVLDRS